MRLIYEGTDITADVDIHSCVHRDVSRERCDSLEVEFEHAGEWYAWQPAHDDRIEIVHGGYSTGVLYLNTILPENGRYKIIATALPTAAHQAGWQSYRDMRLADIMRACAAQCRMDWAVYGLDEGMTYTYLERQDESCAAFLERLLGWEGAVLKCVDGRMAAIAIPYAQDLPAGQEIKLMANQGGMRYRRMPQKKLSGISIISPFAGAAAADSAAAGLPQEAVSHLPAVNSLQAGRWARGMLLSRNRMAEEIALTSELNIGMTAMARIDITGGTDADGKWIVDEAEHDFVNDRTRAKLLRCIGTIQ